MCFLLFVLVINKIVQQLTLSLKYGNCFNQLQKVLCSNCFANCQHCFAKCFNQIHDCSSSIIEYCLNNNDVCLNICRLFKANRRLVKNKWEKLYNVINEHILKVSLKN